MSKFKELEEITLELFDDVVIYTVAEPGAKHIDDFINELSSKWKEQFYE